MEKINVKKDTFLPGLGNFLYMREDEKLLSSYNKDFYSTLNSLGKTKFPKISTNNTKNYFYEYHANENASITSSTQQMCKTIEDAYELSIELKADFIEIDQHLRQMKKQVEDIDSIKEYSKYTKDIRFKVQNFLVDQKTESFKLVKEIAILSKEKIEIQSKILLALEKVKKLESEIGIRNNIFNNSMEDQIKSYNTTENRFFEKDLDD